MTPRVVASIPVWSGGKGLAIDVAVTSPFAAYNVGREEPCEHYTLKKHADYDGGFVGAAYVFAALTFDTTGGVNREGATSSGNLSASQPGNRGSISRFTREGRGPASRATCRSPWPRPC